MNIRAIVLLLVIPMAVACGDTAGRSGTSSTTSIEATPHPALPIHNLSIEDGVAASELEATLTLDDGCLLLQGDPTEPLLAVWPSGTTFAHKAVEFGGRTVGVGEEHIFGGGEASRDAPALADTDLPDSCTYGSVWLISE